MKAKYILFTLLAGCLTASSGCKKWLDVSPKTQVRESEMLKDEQGFKDAITGTYIQLSDAPLYGQTLTMSFMDVLGQRYNVTNSTSPFYQTAIYNYLNDGTKGTIASIWTNMYGAIGNVNNILTIIDGKKELFSGNNYGRIKGEALGLRALLHFDLLRMFGAAPIVDAQRKAIPYVTGFGVKVTPLLTVQNVIDSCLNDLRAAEGLLAADKIIREDYNTDPFQSFTRNHINYWAVKGLEARILLYGNDKINALAAALEVINNHQSNFPFVTGPAASASYNRDRAYAREQLFALNVYKMKAYSDEYFTTTSTGAPPLSVTSKALNTLYETAAGGSSDIRFNYQFNANAGAFATAKYTIDNINTPYLLNNVPVIRLSEMYYIAAECATLPADGVAYLNEVRAHRGLVALPLNISAANLQTAILKEYKKEFYAEGQLFYYFKRLNAPKIDGSSILTSDAVYIFPLPDNETEFGNR
ncbi:SusD-like starch-binding protein associating with outer membrane [Chitinophaga niastensis]|uniref:SusD-like starch-binding protein associating with outer membrane n=1 Tax=Chitinophaga niastensis TaxID=536980 RepID=A0A2P8HUG7_CHINA|nr:RagB/SusD family nutrient uptake outer membrane protein [Chitinophaga niastensis]PSL49858.1 SusD-like starch-binding protein associating with outer membrane [Chitinophaga niastensis]